VARAKRTARAEARRRYRATIAENPEAEAADGAAETERTEGRPRPAPRRATEPVERPSIVAAFRSSFRPLDLRGDLRALPRLLVSRAFLAPTVASGLAYILFVFNQDVWALQFWQYFSGQFPVVAIFIGGFFAPRASWLIGILIAVTSILFQLELFVRAYPEFLGILLVQGVFFGALFGSAAAWYRRFLRRANPNSAARQASGSSRRPDGKIARKPQQRPMLARRR